MLAQLPVWIWAKRSCGLAARGLAMLAPRPAAGPALTFLQLFLRSPNAALPCRLPLGVLDPADELVAGQGRDVLPCTERRLVADQRLPQIRRQLVNHSTGDSLATHAPMVEK